MKKSSILLVIGFVIIPFFLSGCLGNFFGGNTLKVEKEEIPIRDIDGNTKTIVKTTHTYDLTDIGMFYHSKASATSDLKEIATNKISAIKEQTACANCTDTENAWAKASGLIAINSVEIPDLFENDQRPKGGWDIADNLVNHSPYFIMGWIVEALGLNKGNTELNAENMNINESFNPIEAHMTGSDNSGMSIPFKNPTTTTTTTTVPVL